MDDNNINYTYDFPNLSVLKEMEIIEKTTNLSEFCDIMELGEEIDYLTEYLESVEGEEMQEEKQNDQSVVDVNYVNEGDRCKLIQETLFLNQEEDIPPKTEEVKKKIEMYLIDEYLNGIYYYNKIPYQRLPPLFPRQIN